MAYRGRFIRVGKAGQYPVLGAYLTFIEREMLENPPSIQPLSADLLARAERLVGDMEVNLEERID